MKKNSFIILMLGLVFSIQTSIASTDLNISFENKIYSDKEINQILNSWKKVFNLFDKTKPEQNKNYVYYINSSLCLNNGDLTEDLNKTFSESFIYKIFINKNHFSKEFKNNNPRLILFLNPLDKETLVLMNNLDLVRSKNVIIVFLGDGSYDYDFLTKLYFDELGAIFSEKVNMYKYFYYKNQKLFEKLRTSRFQYLENNKEVNTILAELDVVHVKANELLGRKICYTKPIGGHLYTTRDLEKDKKDLNWEAFKIKRDMRIKNTPYVNFF